MITSYVTRVLIEWVLITAALSTSPSTCSNKRTFQWETIWQLLRSTYSNEEYCNLIGLQRVQAVYRHVAWLLRSASSQATPDYLKLDASHLSSIWCCMQVSCVMIELFFKSFLCASCMYSVALFAFQFSPCHNWNKHRLHALFIGRSCFTFLLICVYNYRYMWVVPDMSALQ